MKRRSEWRVRGGIMVVWGRVMGWMDLCAACDRFSGGASTAAR